MSWRISRGDPGARVVGRARRVFNHVNPNCTYENLRVYANGRISSGQGSWIDDLPRFREDLSSGKISASPIRRDRPQDRDVHLTGKGWLSGPGRLTRAEYVALTSDESLWLWVEETIAELARDCAVRGATGFHYERKTGEGAVVWGEPLEVFFYEAGEWFLDDVMIYADGRCQVGRDGDVVAFDDIVEGFRSGRLSSRAPDGAWINFDGLGRMLPAKGQWFIEPEDLLAQAKDVLARLRGREGCLAFCLRALDAFEKQPCADNLEILQWAYAQTPKQMRIELNKENVIRAYLGLPRVFDFIDYCPYAGPGPQPRPELVRRAK